LHIDGAGCTLAVGGRAQNGISGNWGAAMISPFSKMMDYAVEGHFRKDPNGRSVFLPLIYKRKGYFVDSKSDEEKIRAFLKMYRSASTLLSWLVFPSIYFPGLILSVYGVSPMRNKLTIYAWIASVFILFYAASAWMLWSVYKGTIPSLTSSLSEVGPDIMGQLSEISPRPRRLAFVAAGLLLIGFALLAAFYQHFRK
jgi:hypothetical protein